MKKFLLTILLAVAALSVSGQDFGRRVALNDDWRFNLGDLKYGGIANLPTDGWQEVTVPHDWSVLQQASPLYASCTGFFPGGIGWYRRQVDIPATEQGNKVYVYFEGVYNNSEVYFNGQLIGKRPYGYVSFMYDLTPYVKWGESNSLAVKVDHSEDADSRWYTGSGIYRDVWLVYANPVHIDLWGVAYSATVTGDKAVVKVNTEIKNDSAQKATVKVKEELLDAEGKVVATAVRNASVAAGETGVVELALNLNSPNLWDLENPYLYTLNTTVMQGSKQIDESSCKVGIRTLDFDPDKGFSLNGKNIKMKGVCVHHDSGALGAAAYKSVWRYRLENLKKLGCNALRTSHNPQATSFYELCDEMGFLVMDEAFDEWEYPKNKWIEGWNVGEPGHQGYAKYFAEWNVRDVHAMVKRDRKHASVVMWSIGNEVDYPNDPYSHPVLDREGIGQQHVAGYKPERPNANRLGAIGKVLAAQVRDLDMSRPVTAALAGAVMSNETELPGALDVVGYNYTENRYDMDHKTYPQRVLYGSENRHDIESWYAVKDNEFIFGQFIWTGIDYLGESRGWPVRGFSSGLLDMAGNIKPSGYFRRALWAESPVAYVGTYQIPALGASARMLSTGAPHVWNYDNGTPIRVVCYTNCEAAELMLNGKRVGERKQYDPKTGIIYWDINYQPGTLSVVAYNGNEKAAEDSVKTTGVAVKMQAEVLDNVDGGAERIVVVTMLDEAGNRVMLADNEVSCVAEGGVVLGMENGSDDATVSYTDAKHRCKDGTMLVFVRKTAEQGALTLKSPMIPSVKVEL